MSAVGSKTVNFDANRFNTIRLLASIQVLLIHAIQYFGVGVPSVALTILHHLPGVPIFFGISGYLVSASLERSASASEYYKKRAMRIYPALLVCLALSTLSVLVLHDVDATLADWTWWLLAQASIGQAYNPNFLRGYATGVLNGSLWTIPVEIQFYLVLPAIYYLCKKRGSTNVCLFGVGAAFLLTAVILELTLRKSNALPSRVMFLSLIPYLYQFMIGVLLQRYRLFVSRYLAGKAIEWWAAYAALAFALQTIGLETAGLHLNPLSAGVLTLAVVATAYGSKVRAPTAGACDLSYGVYIYHMPIVNALLALGALPPWGNLLAAVALSLSIAYASWTLVEWPSLRHLRNQKEIDSKRAIEASTA